MRRSALALACAAMLLGAGCGGDDESTDSRPAGPVPTIPDSGSETGPDTGTDTTETTTTPDAPVEPEPAPAEPEPDPGGATVPAEPPVDSPTNDTPPPPGSDAERFEEFCNQNPGACG